MLTTLQESYEVIMMRQQKKVKINKLNIYIKSCNKIWRMLSFYREIRITFWEELPSLFSASSSVLEQANHHMRRDIWRLNWFRESDAHSWQIQWLIVLSTMIWQLFIINNNRLDVHWFVSKSISATQETDY